MLRLWKRKAYNIEAFIKKEKRINKMKEGTELPQFTVVFNNGATSLVTAPDKYEAITVAKERSRNTSGVKEVKDQRGQKV